MRPSTPPHPRGWILYDGRCGMCSASARRLRRAFQSLGFAVIPLQTPWVTAKLGRGPSLAPQEMLLLTRDDRTFGGIDAYVHIAGQLWWARPFAWLARLRLVDLVLRKAYRFIAAHRRRISAVCRLTPDLP